MTFKKGDLVRFRKNKDSLGIIKKVLPRMPSNSYQISYEIDWVDSNPSELDQRYLFVDYYFGTELDLLSEIQTTFGWTPAPS